MRRLALNAANGRRDLDLCRLERTRTHGAS